MTGFHPIDIAIVIAYFVILAAIGKFSHKHSDTGEGYFLAGRKLGKAYQFFLNFANSVGSNDATSTATVVYKQGISGIWLGFQMVFLNPYYWFMFVWFRRVRLTTMSELFEERLGSRPLGVFYTAFQITMAVVVIMGLGNLVSYKISAALVLKPEARWTEAERHSVDGYSELMRHEAAVARGETLPEADASRLSELRELHAKGALASYVSAINPWMFYIIYVTAIGIYIILGGLTATAIVDAFQGVLIMVFSIILIPAGLAVTGGAAGLSARLPEGALALFGTSGASEFTIATVAAILLATLMQAHSQVHNMTIGGSARNEYAARFGAVTGTFGKRFLTIAWAVCGLVGIAMYSGANALADPDLLWGTMSRELLGPGLLGLMIAGVLAANMSTVATQAMAVSALFARNIYGMFKPKADDASMVRAGRWMIVVALVVSIVSASQMTSIYSVLKFAMTVNIPFGAAILLMFIWRRLTAKAVWAAVVCSIVACMIFPALAQHVPALAKNPVLAQRVNDSAGRLIPVYYETVAREHARDPDSPFIGSGRLHTELLLLRAAGIDPALLSPGSRLAARFLVNVLLPLAILIGVSLCTRRPPRASIDFFYGKMKTPVAPTPELDALEIEKTRRAPSRFDNTKIWPRSSWEFTKWDKVDTTGFLLSCLVTLLMVALLAGLVRLLAIA